jgi:acyl transferase domain-containing protein/acyl carrier protein
MNSTMPDKLTGLEIAVIGISARFPNAVNIHRYWENLRNGIECISFFSREELLQEGYPPELVENDAYVKAKGIMENIEYFDSSFFDYSSREAEIMDPQMRIFHEIAWEALEDAAYAPGNFKGLIGFYAGAAHNHRWIGLSAFSGKTRNIGQWAADQLVDKGYMTMRVSYKLNLRGPSYSMYTACSTSLVAVHLACQAILNGECDMALAGGITITLPNKIGYMYQEGMIMSPDGHCRAFDADAGGTVVGNGAGIVVLKRLEDALEHNDHIYAVIKGSAINNDGIRKSGFTAPSVEGQVEVIRTAQQMAGVTPASITYIETHGTGTAIGDPIEIEALTMAFNTPERNFCALSAVKSNIGHLDAAAGIAGFIKAVLALMHRQIPPSLHYKNPNLQIDFENSPFYLNTTLKEWKNETVPLRAGVSSFGIGGTNAHVILEGSSEITRGLDPLPTALVDRPQLLLLSAKSETALQQIGKNLANHLENNRDNPDLTLADIAYTLHVGREAFKYRKALIATDKEEASRLLTASTDPDSPHFAAARVGTARDKNRLVFMFPGQGSQYVNMGRDLYEKEPIFKKEMDRCLEILNGLLDYHIKEILYPGDMDNRSYRSNTSHKSYKSHIDQTEIAQPVIFAFQYALAKLLMQWGFKPYAMMGHSIGEYAAACLAGVFSLEDGLQLAVQRGKLMQQMPPGAMLSVTLPREQIQPWLDQYPGLALAAVNAPSLCVVSGPREITSVLANQLETKGIQCRLLHTSHAFHSSMMDPVLKPFENIVRKIILNQPQVPYISNVTGKWIALGDAVDPAYWAKHLRSTVQFSAGLINLLKEENTIFIESGPGRSLETFVKKHITKDAPPIKVLNLVKHPREETPDSYYLMSKIAQLWLNGEAIDVPGFYAGQKRTRLSLPTYPFERKKYWLEAQTPAVPGPGLTDRSTVLEKQAKISHWFYAPSWKRSLPPTPAKHHHFNWLFFMDEIGIGEQIIQRLNRLNAHYDEGKRSAVVTVRPGENFTQTAENSYRVNPLEPGDYQALIAQLKEQDKLPHRVVHLWNFMPHPRPGTPGHQDEDYDDRGFYSLINLARALGKEEIEKDTKIIVVTNNMQEVSGRDLLNPRQATVLGAAAVIPKEYSNLDCCCIDVMLPPGGAVVEELLIDWLQAECTTDIPHNENGEMIAYRSGYRWIQTYDPLPLPPLADPPKTIPRLKQKGVYLITGGTGGIGLQLAQCLAKTVKARLILTSRTPLPRKEEWSQWLNTHLPGDNTSEIIRKIQEIESTGAEVMHFSADVADETQMKEVVTRAGEKWPPLNGVIHAAGIAGGGLIQLKTPRQASSVMLPKVKGTLVLDKLLENHPLDFLILCSSINSIIPFMGQVDYYAANAFLDAFAYYKNSRDGIYTVSINWDTWKEVGMAVKAAKQLTRGRSTHREIPGTSHPLFDYRIHENPQKEIYVTHLKLNRHWVLNEHKVIETGKGLIPGVTYLEMAREALAQHAGHGSKPIEISEIYFLNPLMVDENEEKETRFILEKQKDTGEYEFQVQSRNDEHDENWQKHAVGKIKPLQPEEPIRHEINAIEAKCNKNEIAVAQTGVPSQSGLLYFGPRWGSINRVLIGEKQGLAFLQLDEAFFPDLDAYKLHPALLDSAAGFLFRYIYPGSAYIPFSFKKVQVKSPLPAKIISCSRIIEDSPPSSKETLKFDVTIMDQQGRELVDIKEFTMLEVSREVQRKINTPPTAAIPKKEKEKIFLKDGILPREGVEVFKRILCGALPQVVVSTLDLTQRIKSNRAAPSRFLVEEIDKRKSIGPGDARPEISTVYAAPASEIEQTLADVWQEILGIDKVGIHDDFFELGGDSLNIVQLNGMLKKQLKRDIPVAVLFRYLTIHSFVQYLHQQDGNKKAPVQKKDRSKIIKESRNRLEERILRRTSRR